MKLVLFTFIICAILLLSACAPTPQHNPIVAATTVFTRTHNNQHAHSHAQRGHTEQALLSDFPGDDYCKLDALIPAGTQVDVIGAYHDYIAVAWDGSAGSTEGFVPRAKLGAVPPGIPEARQPTRCRGSRCWNSARGHITRPPMAASL